MEEKPNWHERIQTAISQGEDMDCSGIDCEDCIFDPADGEHCDTVFPYNTEEDLKRLTLIHRHLLTTAQDWGDRDEARNRLAEMLDDDAREKFLGKAEPTGYKVRMIGKPYTRLPGGDSPDLGYVIETGRLGTEYDAANIAAAFRDEETRDRVLEFLNAGVNIKDLSLD